MGDHQARHYLVQQRFEVRTFGTLPSIEEVRVRIEARLHEAVEGMIHAEFLLGRFFVHENIVREKTINTE